jgi:hypothetical protein
MRCGGGGARGDAGLAERVPARQHQPPARRRGALVPAHGTHASATHQLVGRQRAERSCRPCCARPAPCLRSNRPARSTPLDAHSSTHLVGACAGARNPAAFAIVRAASCHSQPGPVPPWRRTHLQHAQPRDAAGGSAPALPRPQRRQQRRAQLRVARGRGLALVRGGRAAAAAAGPCALGAGGSLRRGAARLAGQARSRQRRRRRRVVKVLEAHLRAR